jgi:FAD dependent oxidoreductase TIGR03364
MLLLRYPESTAVAEAFVAGEMGEGCILMSPAEAAERLAIPGARAGLGALWSPHEIRVESRAAVPALAGWLAEAHGVAFMSRTAVLSVAPPRIETSHGPVAAGSAVVCPGDDLTTLFPDSIAAHGVEKASLTMLRLEDPGWRLPATLMSDLGLARYLGYAALPPAEALRRKLERTDPDALAHGIHLIVAQGSDGRLIVGDSHHYGDLADPFMDARVEALILEEFRTATGLEPPPVATRWAGSYARAAGPMFVETPLDGVRLVMVTSGTGASTAFAIAEEVVGEMFGADLTDLPLEGKHT